MRKAPVIKRKSNEGRLFHNLVITVNLLFIPYRSEESISLWFSMFYQKAVRLSSNCPVSTSVSYSRFPSIQQAARERSEVTSFCGGKRVSDQARIDFNFDFLFT